MRTFTFVFVTCLLSGCPESRSLSPDGGATDAGILVVDVGAADAPAADAPDLGDVVVRGSAAALAGRTAWVRVFDNSVFVGTPWRTVTVAADGTFEERFVDGMPADVFGVFVDVFLDAGDGACSGDPAYRLFASNDFSAEIAVTFDADPGTATTCAELGW